MKTLLLTTAATLTLTLVAPGAFADHNRYDHDGQDAVAFGNGYGYSYGFNGYNQNANHRLQPGYAGLNSGWSVGAFNPGWNNGWNVGRQLDYGANYGYGQQLRPSTGCGQQQPSIAPGGCFRVGGQTICPTQPRYRAYSPATPFGMNNSYGFGGPLR